MLQTYFLGHTAFNGKRAGFGGGIFPGGWLAAFPYLLFVDGLKALLRLHCEERAKKMFWEGDEKG